MNPLEQAVSHYATLIDNVFTQLETDNVGFIGDPVFEGQLEPEMEKSRVKGRGKWMPPSNKWWSPPPSLPRWTRWRNMCSR